ncbi:hypothetical protein OsI_38654 [Oryza sativa Indica Group]|uniref:Uncharacterized protein n=1 Tax=Oryza sativa subsp. indica TaxID=39946 RepID=B8BME1_ORYSI|nr:hypothetical protein OsI_38654 [Oryza sativa Indica Group]
MVFRKEDDDDDSDQYWRALVGILVLLLQALVIAIILLPLALLYLFGLLVSTGLSMWRLIERDYGGEDGGANLTPALNVLYSLALFQGVLFCYHDQSAMNPVSILGSQVKQAQVLLENKKEQNVATTATSTNADRWRSLKIILAVFL